MADDVAEKPKIRAEDNPWYWLATLYGKPEPSDTELQTRNRVAWNRCMASKLTDEARDRLIKSKRHPAEELAPFSQDEQREVEAALLQRSDGRATAVAEWIQSIPAFSNTEFEALPFAGMIFPASGLVSYIASVTCSGGADFGGATCSGGADFGDATFPGGAYFGGATLSGGANFCRATFSGDTSFGGAIFSGGGGFLRADFDGATFSGVAIFKGVTFSGDASFRVTTFSAEAYFGGATFSADACFGGAIFSYFAGFDKVTFSGPVHFTGATFSDEARFDGATFADSARFDDATFSDAANFVNCEMKAYASFRGTDFSQPPLFFGAKLHEGTVWHDAVWPKRPEDAAEAEAFVLAYERLKLEMDRLKKHEDELDFFARELQARRVLYGFGKGLPIAVYGGLCNYGRSYIRPLSILLVTVLAGAIPFWPHFGGRITFRPFTYSGHARDALGLSIANTFGILGIRKDLIAASVLEALPPWLKVIATVQTGLGLVLLFLFGLGIRNRFRMK